MTRWSDRSREEALLFNPNFLGLLVWSAAAGYWDAAGNNFPFELAFLAVPVVLHKATRQALPQSPRTSLAAWLESNPYFRVGFHERATGLAPFVREGILFASVHGLIAFTAGGRLQNGRRPR